MKWSVLERTSRTVSPFSKLTFPEWVENRINEGTLASLRAAIFVDPANARAAAIFGWRCAEYSRIEKEIGPDLARHAWAEADFQTRRACKLAPYDDQVKKLRARVVALLQLPG